MSKRRRSRGIYHQKRKRKTALIPKAPEYMEVSRTPYRDVAMERAQALRDEGYKTRVFRGGPFKDYRICRSHNKREPKPPKEPRSRSRKKPVDPAQGDIFG